MNSLTDFQQLEPNSIIEAVESLGLDCDARIFPLNSYENRVYQIGIENNLPLIGKFYRPRRWSNQQILEEHHFSQELADLEIPVIAPLAFNGESLIHYKDIRFALFPRKGGSTPELGNPDHLKWMGRLLGRIHAAGAHRPFEHRPTIDIESFVIEPSSFLLDNAFIPDYLEPAYRSLLDDILKLLQQHLASINFHKIRLHGDCHPGNILWTEHGPHFVDFDDCRMGPAIQDIWMLLSGSIDEQRKQLDDILDGYYEFCDFNPVEARLIETLRTLRIIHYSGWLARRWDDPSFPMNFPWFNTPGYWEQHVLTLREQFALLQDNEQHSI
ncbi:MAG: serine/threonine protein kinase [Gammaproteobacteria bacterium]|nr:serine/threonine protein kinase [Gammaproteobacteria bacterium]